MDRATPARQPYLCRELATADQAATGRRGGVDKGDRSSILAGAAKGADALEIRLKAVKHPPAATKESAG